MTDKIKLDEVLEELYALREETHKLKVDNDFLQRQNASLKSRCHKLSLEHSCLEREIQDMKFTRQYLTSEDAGKAFARELLGKPMTANEVAVEAAENRYDAYVGDDF